jgi:Uma2 family endonuclease
MSPEEFMMHNLPKGEYSTAISSLLKRLRLGKFFYDRTLVTNLAAGLSTEPDGTFVSFKTIKAGRVRFVEGHEGWVEMEGSPDMTLEIVSVSSVKKDTIELRELYWRAGVREYWLVNPLEDEIQFDILRRARSGYIAMRRRSGWIESRIFGKSFKLTSTRDELGYPEYTLRVR